MDLKDKVNVAKQIANTFHEDNGDTYGRSNDFMGDRDKLPYLAHLEDVVRILLRYGETDKHMLCAAYLHDVVEDVGLPLTTVVDIFGYPVKNLVWAVTDEPGANRKERKAATYKKIRSVPGATMLKLADRIANVENCIRTNETRMLKMYQKEQADFAFNLRILGELDPMWDHLEFMLAYEKLDAFPPDVHTEHCCGEHMHCKYGEEEDACTVARGMKLARYRCNCAHM